MAQIKNIKNQMGSHYIPAKPEGKMKGATNSSAHVLRQPRQGRSAQNHPL